MFDAPLSDGVSLFIWIVCILAGLGAALTAINVISVFSKKKEADEDTSHSTSSPLK